tara:strand:- start:852 stop:2255 length:1404 start_codon:yes stop_codon:yes gene_type:complete
MPTGMISEKISWGILNNTAPDFFPFFPLSGVPNVDITFGNWKGNPSVPSLIQTPALSGQITVNLGTGIMTGAFTSFTTELVVGDFIWFNDGLNLESQVIVEITNIFSNFDAQCDINLLTLPDGSPIPFTYSNRIYFLIDPTDTLQDLVYLQSSIDTSTSSSSQAVAGNRLYYTNFQAYNWNTGVMENVAQTYATSIGAQLKDLGWQDATSWETAIGTLLSYAGWNDTLTTVVPDTTLIDNSNQEIVVYYREITTAYKGTPVQVIDDMIFYEQSNVAQDYKTQLGFEPFGQQRVAFNAGDGIGFWISGGNLGAWPNPFAAPYNSIPTGLDMSASSNMSDSFAGYYGDDNVFIGEYQTTYNQTATGLILTNQDFQPNQFQVYFQYTVYDGLEAVAAEELTKQGIQVSPENVDWYRKNIERLAEVEAIDWEFDEENPPERDEPKEYNPEEDNDPRDYVPRNAKEVNNDGN